QQGGGETGKRLRQMGVLIEALISKMFLDNGELDLSRFDEAAQYVIEKSLECARNKGNEKLGRGHLLYGLLVNDNGVLPKLLRAQGKNAEHIASLLYITMPAGVSITSRIEAKVACLSQGLIKILCVAEADVKGRQEAQIEEARLLRAFLVDGGGEAG